MYIHISLYYIFYMHDHSSFRLILFTITMAYHSSLFMLSGYNSRKFKREKNDACTC